MIENIDLELLFYVLVSTQLLNLSILCWILYMFRKQRLFMGSLMTDAHRVEVEPEMIQTWIRQLETLPVGSVKYEAYRKNLIKVNALPDGY